MIMMVMMVLNMMAMMIAHWREAMRGRNCSTSYYSYYFYHLHQCVHQTSVTVSPPKISHIEIIIITKIIFSKVLMAEFLLLFCHISGQVGVRSHIVPNSEKNISAPYFSPAWMGNWLLSRKNTPEEVHSCYWDLTDVADEDSYSTIPDIYHFWGTTALFRPVKR